MWQAFFVFGFFPPQGTESAVEQTTWDPLVYKLYPFKSPRRAENSAKWWLGLLLLACFFSSFFIFLFFFFPKGRIWHGGNVWTVGQTQKFKVFITFFKLTFLCPFGYMRLRFLLCPQKQENLSYSTCIALRGGGNPLFSNLHFTRMFSLMLLAQGLSPEVTGSLPVWCIVGPTGEIQTQPRGCCNLALHSDLQLGHPHCHAQVLFLLSERQHGWWRQKTYFSWKLATIIAAREQGFSEGHQTLQKAQFVKAQVTAQVTFSSQICSFSLPLIFHFCWVNKTRPSSAVTNFQSHLCSRIDRVIWGLPICSLWMKFSRTSCLKGDAET